MKLLDLFRRKRTPFGMREYDVDSPASSTRGTVRVLARDACDAVERAGFFPWLCLGQRVMVRVVATHERLLVKLDGLKAVLA